MTLELQIFKRTYLPDMIKFKLIIITNFFIGHFTCFNDDDIIKSFNL